MFDEMDRLRDVNELHALLTHYGDWSAPDRAAWQDRLCRMEGVEPRQLVRLHGELIAYGWIEQNTGIVPVTRHSAASGCYRITPAGLYALKQLAGQEIEAA